LHNSRAKLLRLQAWAACGDGTFGKFLSGVVADGFKTAENRVILVKNVENPVENRRFPHMHARGCARNLVPRDGRAGRAACKNPLYNNNLFGAWVDGMFHVKQNRNKIL
jgi:hypothetical protein